jgi:hypothetical protein
MMKRLFLLLITALLILALSACDNSDTKKINTISTVELTDREYAILSTTSDQSFVFDFKVDNEYEEVTVWIEKYESGKLIGDKLSSLTTKVKKKGSIIFTTNKTNDNHKELTFNIGVSSNGSIGSVNGTDSSTDTLDGMTSVSGTFQGETTLMAGKAVLASISYSKADSMSTLTPDFYNDTDAHLSELEDYDVVYLLRVEFLK